jgi:hypothetical protein
MLASVWTLQYAARTPNEGVCGTKLKGPLGPDEAKMKEDA